MADAADNAELVQLPGVGHLSPAEDPEGFSRHGDQLADQAFLSRIGATGGVARILSGSCGRLGTWGNHDEQRPATHCQQRTLPSYPGAADLIKQTAGQALVLRGLTKTFGQYTAVDHIDLDVPAGSFFGLVGPNGAGKTTTLSMVTGLLRPDAGRVIVAGVDVWADPAAAKARMGVLPGRAAAVRAAVRARIAQLPGPAPRHAGRHGGRPGIRTDPGARPGRGRQQAGRRLLHRDAQEDHPGRRDAALAGRAAARRTARGRRPGLGADHPQCAVPLHRRRRHRGVLLARDGPGRGPVLARRGDGQGPDHRLRRAGGRPRDRRPAWTTPSCTWSAPTTWSRGVCRGWGLRKPEMAAGHQPAAGRHRRQTGRPDRAVRGAGCRAPGSAGLRDRLRSAWCPILRCRC